jgi:calcium-dependent protein kinase
MELIEGGELFDELVSPHVGGKFNEPSVVIIIRQLLSCLAYCHKNGICHRDLKPENILLEASKDLDKIKLIDFGQSRRYTEKSHFSDTCGTPYYVAPEILGKNHNKECDIWSTGVITYILLSGIPPFNGYSNQEIMEKVKIGKFSFGHKVFQSISSEAKDFISKCIVLDPAGRMTPQEALEHPWILNGTQVPVNREDAKEALENLLKFHQHHTLKQATLTFIASQLISKEEKERLGAVFRALDKNSDGVLSRAELREGFNKFQVGQRPFPEELFEAIFAAMDSDKSGSIDYTEFIVGSLKEQYFTTNERLKAAFKMFDKDGSNVIDKSEIRQVLGGQSNLPPSVIEKLIEAVDLNKDGVIQFEEFTTMMKNASM